MVEWKAVSKTATCGTSGNAAMADSRPATVAGLCSGASGISSRMTSMTSAVTIVGSLNWSAPWTARWPTPASSPTSDTAPVRSKAAVSAWNASPWSAIVAVEVDSTRSASAPPRMRVRCVTGDSSSPIRSTSPVAQTTSDSVSTSWYFSDDEPAFTTRTIIAHLPSTRLRPPAGPGRR